MGSKDATDYEGAKVFIGLRPRSASAHNNIEKPQKQLRFKAALTSYADQHNSNWAQKPGLFGAMGIAYQKSAKRSIKIAFSVPAFSRKDAEKNLAKCSVLSRHIYPQIPPDSSQAPESAYWELEFANFTHARKGQKYLLGWIPEYSFVPDLDVGMFVDSKGRLFPKNIKISLTFNVIQDYKGIQYDGEKGDYPKKTRKFPYGVRSMRSKYGISGGKKGKSSGGTPDQVKQANQEKILQ